MKIPQVKTCCCGCSLRTGTKIIGWLLLVSAIFMVVTVAVLLVASYTPEQTNKDNATGQKVILWILTIIYVINCALALMLLLGAYQNKAKLVLIWVIVAFTVAILSLVLNIASMITSFNAQTIGYFINFLIELYFILVVYSFYREIENVSTNYS